MDMSELLFTYGQILEQPKLIIDGTAALFMEDFLQQCSTKGWDDQYVFLHIYSLVHSITHTKYIIIKQKKGYQVTSIPNRGNSTSRS